MEVAMRQALYTFQAFDAGAELSTKIQMELYR